jgi:hypothetical protein
MRRIFVSPYNCRAILAERCKPCNGKLPILMPTRRQT